MVERAAKLGKKKKYDQLIKYMKQYKADLELCIKTMKKSIKKEELHSFRLSIKKLRAISRLLNNISEEKLKFASTISLVYKASGCIREAQINSHIAKVYLEANEPLKAYVSYQDRLIDRYKSKLRSQIKQIDKDKYASRWKILQSVVKEVSEKEFVILLEHYILTELQAILVIDHQSDDIENIHQIRKHVKGIYFILKLSTELDVNLKLNNKISDIKAFSDRIGDWHDQVVLSDSLIHFKELMIRCGKDQFSEALDRALDKLAEATNQFKRNLHQDLEELETCLKSFA